MATEHLSELQIRGLVKLGGVIAPGGNGLPTFAGCGCAYDIDRVLDHMPESDRSDVKLLLRVLGLLPAFLVAAFVRLLDASIHVPGSLGSFLRFARIGVRGLVMSLYWANSEVHRALDYDVSVYTGDQQVADSEEAVSEPAVGGDSLDDATVLDQ